MWKCNIPHVYMCTTCANVENMCNFCPFLGTNVDFYIMGTFSLSNTFFLGDKQPILIGTVIFAVLSLELHLKFFVAWCLVKNIDSEPVTKS